MQQGQHAEVQRQANLVLEALAAAEVQHRQAVAAFPRSYRSLANLGTVYLLRGELFASLAGTAAAAGDAQAASGLRQTAADHVAAAEDWYKRALAIHPQLPGGQRDLEQARSFLRALAADDSGALKK